MLNLTENQAVLVGECQRPCNVVFAACWEKESILWTPFCSILSETRAGDVFQFNKKKNSEFTNLQGHFSETSP